MRWRERAPRELARRRERRQNVDRLAARGTNPEVLACASGGARRKKGPEPVEREGAQQGRRG